MRILLSLLLLFSHSLAYSKPLQETPETKPGSICPSKKGPRPKKDVEIQPYCPEETPTPKPKAKPKKGPPKAKPEK